jgi:hypothetical protein
MSQSAVFLFFLAAEKPFELGKFPKKRKDEDKEGSRSRIYGV